MKKRPTTLDRREVKEMKKFMIVLSILLVTMVAAGGIAMACGNGDEESHHPAGQTEQSSDIQGLDMQTEQSLGIQSVKTSIVPGLAALAGAGLVIGLLRTILT